MRTRHRVIVGACLAALFATSHASAQTEPVRRIAFGSGASQERPQPIWDAIGMGQPDLFLFLGDAIYGDTENVEILKAKYAQLAAVPGYQKLIRTCPVYATWDGHDYGAEAGGADYPQKAAAQKLFLDFFRDAPDSLRRKRPGVYGAWVFGPSGKRMQVILLDTRYFRSPLKAKPGGGYLPNTDPDATLLGPDQWQWLEGQFHNPAEVRLLVSPIQVVAEDQPYEKWANFPRERERLFQVLRSAKVGGVIVLSGNRNLAELSEMDAGLGYPLFDLTSSGLNMAARRWRPAEVNRHRVAVMTSGDNFGQVQIDWDAPEPRVSLQVRDEHGDVTIRQKVDLSLLRPGMLKPPPPAVASAGPKPERPAPAGTVPVEEAAKHVNEKVTVEMKVRNVGGTRDKKMVFLNSSADFRGKDNFTVVLRVPPEALKEKGIDDPSAYFRDKTVRVTGTVALFRDAPQIVVEDVGQISVVE